MLPDANDYVTERNDIPTKGQINDYVTSTFKRRSSEGFLVVQNKGQLPLQYIISFHAYKK